MTDREVAVALTAATDLERRARAHWTASATNVPERDQALIVMRSAGALRRSLEVWLSTRACRAALQS